MVENIKVSLIRKLEQILDDFADLRSNLVSYLETETRILVLNSMELMYHLPDS